MRCWLFGHKPLVLDFFEGKPFIGVGDQDGDLVLVHLCSICRLLYWEVSNATTNRGLHAAYQRGSVRWN